MILFLGFMISEIMVGCQTMQDNNTVIEIIKVAIPAVVTFIGVFLITRKEKHDKSTEAINKLIRQLGMNDEETLKHGLSSQYNNVIESIGRDGKASLTQQHDLAETMNNFTKDYKETISDRNRLLIENEALKKRLETLQAENKMLRELSKGKKL